VTLLSPLGELRFLDVSENPITNYSLARLAGFQNLESLSIARIDFTNFNETRLSGVPGLSSLGKAEALHLLDLSGLKVTDDDILSLKTFACLRALVVTHRSTNVTAGAFVELRKACKELCIGPHVLQARLVRFDTFDDGWVKSIHSVRMDQLLLLPENERARLVAVTLRKADEFEPLKSCSSIKVLTLVGSRILLRDAELIAALSTLTQLDLQDCEVEPSALETFARAKNLQRTRTARASRYRCRVQSARPSTRSSRSQRASLRPTRAGVSIT
jgi:Leucine-rich repeat (LRR) protein